MAGKTPELVVVGGGLAGSEAAWQAAERGLRVCLYEMRPEQGTGAHTGGDLAELVCSNSLGSNLPDRASGLLKDELRRMGSLLIQLAEEAAVPAGGALAVDRHAFARRITEIEASPGYELSVDLAAQTVTTPSGTSFRFEVDPFRKDCLLNGLDEIGLTLQNETDITAYEQRRRQDAPWLFLEDA